VSVSEPGVGGHTMPFAVTCKGRGSGATAKGLQLLGSHKALLGYVATLNPSTPLGVSEIPRYILK